MENLTQYGADGKPLKKPKDYSQSTVATKEGVMTHEEAYRRGLISSTDMWLNQNVYRGGYYID